MTETLEIPTSEAETAALVARNPTTRHKWSVSMFSEQLGIDKHAARTAAINLEPAEIIGAKKLYWIDQYVAELLRLEREKHKPKGELAKDRAEDARAEKLEIANAKEKGLLVDISQVIQDQAKFSVMQARAIESAPMRIKRKYPDMPGKYLAALQDQLALIYNRVLDDWKSGVTEYTEDDFPEMKVDAEDEE